MRYVSVALLCVTVLGCRDPVAPEPLGARLSVWMPEESAIVAYDGGSSQLAAPRRIIRDSVNFRRVWEDIFAGRFPQPELPLVPFESSVVLVAISGPGSDISIDSVVHFELGRRVYVTEYGPCFGVVPVIVSTFEMVRAPRFNVWAWHKREVPQCSR